MKLNRFFLIIGFLALHIPAFGMNEQEEQAAIETLRIKIENEILSPNYSKTMIGWWQLMRPSDGDSSSKWLSFLKRANEKCCCGFNTVIDNIQNGVANPFGDLIATPAATPQPAPTSAQTTAPASAATPSNANPIGMNKWEKSDAIKTLWRLVESKEIWSGNMTRRHAIKDKIRDMKLNCVGTNDYQPLLDPIKTMNENFALGFDEVISNIEQGIPNPFGEPIVLATKATGAHIVVNVGDIAKLNRNMLSLCHSHTPALIDLKLYVPDDSDKQPEITLAVLKIINEKYKCELDTVIQNIENGVADPFKANSVVHSTPFANHPSTAQPQTNASADTVRMNDQTKQDAIDALSSAMGCTINTECAKGKRSVLLYDWTNLKPPISDSKMLNFLTAMNKTHKLGFDIEIQMIERGTFSNVGPFTQEDIENAVAEEPTSTQTIKQLSGGSSFTLDSTRLITKEDATEHLSFRTTDITITEEDLRRAPANHQQSSHLDELDEPDYTTTRLPRRPFFFGIIALCAAVGIYHYWQEQKKKLQSEDSEENNPDAFVD